MPNWGNQEFNQAATDIASAFVASEAQNGATLNALVEKTARDASLNPEQIACLCRLANTHVFEVKFAKDEEKYVSFELADAGNVVQKIAGGVKTAGEIVRLFSEKELYPTLPNELAEPQPTYVKTASLKQAERSLQRSLARPDPEVLYRQMKVAFEKMSSEARQEANHWQRCMSKVAAATKTMHWNQDAFETDAFAFGGADVMPEVNAIREARGLEPYRVDLQKFASVFNEQLDKIDGKQTPHARLVKEASNARHRQGVCKNAAAVARDRLRSLSEELNAARSR